MQLVLELFEEIILDLLVKNNVKIRKIDEFTYVIDKEESKGMRVPLKIYANDQLLSKMTVDRTINQAVNVTMLAWRPKTCRGSS